MTNLAEKEAKASFLSFCMIAITRVLHYVTSIILLFLLTPNDFGIMAIVMTVMAIMNSLSSFGVDAALISYKGEEVSLIDSAWSLELIKGFLLFLSVLLLSTFIADWLGEAMLKPLLIFVSLGFLIQSSKNIGLVLLRKNLEFWVIFKCEIGMAIVSSLVSLLLAFYYRSPWAIAFGYISGWATYVFLSYLFCSYRPKISFNRSGMLSLLGFSKWILVSGQVNSFLDNGVNLLIGSQFGMSVLGQFERANMFTRQTALQIGEVMWKVGLPSLSARTSDVTMLRDQYLLMFNYICLSVFPIMIIVNKYIPAFVDPAESRNWMLFNNLLAALGVTAVVGMLMTPGSILFQSLRKPRIGFYIAILRLVSILIFIIPLMQVFGSIGVAYTLLLGGCISLPYHFYRVQNLIGVSLSRHIFICSKYLAPCLIFTTLSPGNASVIWDATILTLTSMVYLALLYFLSGEFRMVVKFIYKSWRDGKNINS